MAIKRVKYDLHKLSAWSKNMFSFIILPCCIVNTLFLFILESISKTINSFMTEVTIIQKPEGPLYREKVKNLNEVKSKWTSQKFNQDLRKNLRWRALQQ